jgi:hypothetical protein
MGPHCGSVYVLKEMMTDLGLYMGPFNNVFDAALVENVKIFAASKGMRREFNAWTEHGPKLTDRLCAAIIAAWYAKTSPAAPSPRIPASLLGRRVMMTSGAVPQEADVTTTDPIADCAAYGGEWDYLSNTCLMLDLEEEGMSPTLKYALIGGAVLLVAGAGYGIYRATR